MLFNGFIINNNKKHNDSFFLQIRLQIEPNLREKRKNKFGHRGAAPIGCYSQHFPVCLALKTTPTY